MSEDQPTYLITGATGFLGRHILKSLRRAAPDAGVAILVRDRMSWVRQIWRDEVGEVEVIEGSLFRIDDWKNDPRLSRVDGIFHLAGIVRHSRSDPDEMIHANVDGTLSMVHLAAEKKSRLLFVSTSGTVGSSLRIEDAPNEDAPFCESVVGSWPYYASKIRAEKEARALAERLGVQLIVFRPPVMLGPEDHRFRSTAHLLRLLRNKLPFILDGEMHFIDVRDAADAMVRAMLLANPKPVYHLVGARSTLDEFFRMAASEAGIEPKWRVLPARFLLYLARFNQMTGLNFHAIPDPVVIEMATHHWGLSSRYAEEDLGFQTRPPRETLRDTINWMKENT